MKSLIVLLSAVVLVGCSSQPEAVVETEEIPYALPDADVYITVADSIGVELGDSNYVFGAIAAAQFSPSGEIAVLDFQKYCINFYTPGGEFIRSIGRQGSGPGEFLLPVSFSFTDNGGLIVADAMARSLVLFDSTGEYTGSLSGFFPTAPSQIVSTENNAFIGMKPEYEQTDEGIFMGFTVARWEEGEVEPSVTYYSS